MSEDSSQNADNNPDDTIKILVASDIHLGYDEKNTTRGEDSFIAFEEVLQHALSNEVDAILLGGDLFHDANPSKNTMNRCMQLLSTYVLGSRPIRLEFLSDQNENFLESLRRTVNYEDPNINIALPVFSIHGNHDDSTGLSRLSSMDLLSTTGYVNYFGKWTDMNMVNIRPILMRKGETKMALYGLSYIRDARLYRLFQDGKVTMERPDEPDFFNVMVVHQNRADRGPKNYLPETSLPSFLDLVIWGHEHDCRIEPEENSLKKFFVCQPGSTVATSLAEGESIPKCCGLLSIYKGAFKVEPIPLMSVRPFEFESVDLDTVCDEFELDEGDIKQKVQDFATQRVDALIERAKKKLTAYPRQPKLPLIRLRLIHTDTKQQFNVIRFGYQYQGRVANVQDIVAFKKKVVRVKDEGSKPLDKQAFREAYHFQRNQRCEDIAERYFTQVDEANQLEVLCSRGMTEFCRRMVNYDDDDAADRIYRFGKEAVLKFLNAQDMITDDNVDEALARFLPENPDLYDRMIAMLEEPSNPFKLPLASDGNATADSGSSILASKPTRGGTRGGKRGGRGSRGVKTGADTTNGSRTQASISSLFSQSSGSTTKTNVASRTSSRQVKGANQRSCQIDFDSDED